MEKYPLEKARTEAEKLTQKISSGEARDYTDADNQIEFQKANDLRKEFRPILDAIDDLRHVYSGELNHEQKQDCVQTIIENEDLFAKALRHHLTIDLATRSLRDLTIIHDPDSEIGATLELFALRTIEKLAPVMEETLKAQVDSAHMGLSKGDAVKLYEILLERGGTEQKAIASHSLITHLEWMGSRMRENPGLEFLPNVHRISGIVRDGNEKEKARARDYLLAFADNSSGTYEKTYIITRLLETEDTEAAIEGYKRVDQLLDTYGLPKYEFLHSWLISGRQGEFQNRILSNLKTIAEVESRIPGICESLYEEYGIMDFGRYPAEVLVRQFEEKDNFELPYGVIIFPRDDYNGAFYQDKKPLSELLNQLRGEFLLRVAECDSKIDIARALINFDKKYNPEQGNGQKISLLILGGHGSENSIRFGGDDEVHRLHINDLAGTGVRKTGSFFEKNPTIILASCSTGAESGIAEEISRVFGAKVIAPKVPTNVLGYYASKKAGQRKFRFHARYHKEDSKSLYDMRKDVI